MIEEEAEERMKAGKADPVKKSRQGPEPIIHIGGHTYREGRTGELIASIAGVSADTVRKVEIIEKGAPEEVKQAARKGEMSVNRAYKATVGKRKKAKRKTLGQPKPSRQLGVMRELQKWWQEANTETKSKFMMWIKAKEETHE